MIKNTLLTLILLVGTANAGVKLTDQDFGPNLSITGNFTTGGVINSTGGFTDNGSNVLGNDILGNSGTATAFASDPANCVAGQYPLGVDASGAVQSCTANATTASSLLANGANCSPGNAPLGVDEFGAVEGCFNPSPIGSPTGAIIQWSTDTAPAGWLECDGSERSRAGEAALFAVIGITYGAGDGSTTFHLPDMRGMFARGWDHGAGTDPDAGSRIVSSSGTVSGDNVGSFQEDELESHRHFLTNIVDNGGVGSQQPAGLPGPQIHNTSFTGGNETRPRNIYLMYIIKR